MKRLLKAVSGIATSVAAVWSLWWIAGQQWVMFAAMVAAFGVWAWRRYRRERAKESIWDRAKDKR
jgi:membrane protein implicated in regulation of membrane protease activity